MKKTLSALLLSVTLLTASVVTVPLHADGDGGGGSYGKTSGLLGPVVLGPKVTVGLPLPLRFGLEGKWDNLVGFSFDYGFFPKLTFDDVSIYASSWAIAARYYPWQRAFYLGLAFGSQTLTGTKTEVFSGESITATADYSTPFLTPQIGWRWCFASGFFLGMELGVQLPISKSFTVSTDREDLNSNSTFETEITRLKNEANAEADKYGSTALPLLALVQFGFFL